MQVHFKLISKEVPGKLLARVEKKLLRLRKRLADSLYAVQAFVEISKDSGSTHSEKAWRASVNVDAQGDRYHAEAAAATPEKASDRMIKELEAELRTRRVRERKLERKAEGFWKSLLHNDFRAP